MLPTVFIGSTTEGRVYAEEVEKGLQQISNCQPWYDGVFQLSGNTQSSLVESIEEADFVVIILTTDDKTSSRDNTFFSPRDNLIFEAGLGFGKVSPDRTFLIPERKNNTKEEVKLPSDLLGFTLASGFNCDDEPQKAVSRAIYQIKERIEQMGCKAIVRLKGGKKLLASSSIELIKSADRHIMMFGRDLSWAETYADAIKDRIEAGVQIEVFAEDPQTAIAKKSSELLKNIGANVYHLDRDTGVKLTLIDYQTTDCSRFMLAFKERKNFGAKGERFSYHCEIHNAKDSFVMWNTFVRLYESTLRDVKGNHE